jgi:integrase
LDLAEEVYHIREPEQLPLAMSVDEIKRLLAVGSSLKTRVLLSLGYGCGLRASEIVRLKVKHIDKAQNIVRIEQSKDRKGRNVMLPDEMLGLLRRWWRVRPFSAAGRPQRTESSAITGGRKPCTEGDIPAHIFGPLNAYPEFPI